MMRSLALALVAVFAWTLSAQAQDRDLDADLRDAVTGYGKALDTEDRDLRLEAFRRAERLFASVVESGRANADLYANLGNAALQAENLGQAVLAYRRALVLDPDHDRALQNLGHVRSLAPDWVPRRTSSAFMDSFFGWHRTLSPGERSMAAAVAFLTAALLISLGIGFRSATARNIAILPGLAWCALIASLAFDPAAAQRDDAVITAPEVIARSADSLHAPASFSRPLPMGTELVIVETRDDWLRVSLANGREAWIRRSAAKRVAEGL